MYSDDKKIQNIEDAKKFFKLYDGPMLLTSPMVLAEFIRIATHPEKFKMSYQNATDCIEKLFEKEHFSLSVPKVKLHNIPPLSLPFFDFSMKIEGISKIGDQIAHGGMIFSKGTTAKFGFSGGSSILSPEEIYENAEWETVTLSSVLYNLLLLAAKESTSASMGSLQYQDALVLMFGRGHNYVHFITSDEKLVKRTGSKPYLDVGVCILSKYLENKYASFRTDQTSV